MHSSRMCTARLLTMYLLGCASILRVYPSRGRDASILPEGVNTSPLDAPSSRGLNDRRLWKHYLFPSSVRGRHEMTVCGLWKKLEWAIRSQLFRDKRKHDLCPYTEKLPLFATDQGWPSVSSLNMQNLHYITHCRICLILVHIVLHIKNFNGSVYRGSWNGEQVGNINHVMSIYHVKKTWGNESKQLCSLWFYVIFLSLLKLALTNARNAVPKRIEQSNSWILIVSVLKKNIL